MKEVEIGDFSRCFPKVDSGRTVVLVVVRQQTTECLRDAVFAGTEALCSPVVNMYYEPGPFFSLWFSQYVTTPFFPFFPFSFFFFFFADV